MNPKKIYDRFHVILMYAVVSIIVKTVLCTVQSIDIFEKVSSVVGSGFPSKCSGLFFAKRYIHGFGGYRRRLIVGITAEKLVVTNGLVRYG